MQPLNAGSQLISAVDASKVYFVKSKLGEGGQGAVYKVIDTLKQEWALKLYNSKSATIQQKEIIRHLLELGSPGNSFLWPVDMIEMNDTFGYIMPLRPSSFVSLFSVVKREVELSFHTVAVASWNIAHGFQTLHSLGLSYRDISFGNIFINPQTGDVLICDNDNASSGAYTSVLGTMDFMAPEIVVGQAMPSMATDRYSLAVLLFYLLMLSHPLHGKLEYNMHSLDTHAKRQLYGTHPVFCYDPDDHSNEPVPGYHDNVRLFWPLYSSEVQLLFVRTFTVGLHDPSSRVTESEWKNAFLNLLGIYHHCTSCGAEVFAPSDGLCWNCHCPMSSVVKLRVGRHLFAAEKDKKLLNLELSNCDNVSEVAGIVVPKPGDNTVLGLRNLTSTPWQYKDAAGRIFTIPQGRTAMLQSGASFQFEHTHATVE